MERLSPEHLLLEESERANTFCVKSSHEQLSDWLNFDQIDLFLEVEKACINNVKRQASSTTVNKSLKTNQGQYTPCSRRPKRLTNLHIKFEHFSDYTFYIEQYRQTKQLRLAERVAKLVKCKGDAENCQITNGSSFDHDRKLESSDFASEQVCVYPKFGQQSHRLSGQRYDMTVKPSLPQSGCFTGRKWVYPKDFARVCRKSIGVKW